MIKSAEQIQAMSRAGAVAREAIRAAAAIIRPGATTRDLDSAAAQVVKRRGASALFIGYTQGSSPPFPAATCISVNEQVVHAIPGEKSLAPGDLVTVDIGVGLDGWCADCARSFVVPDSDEDPFTPVQRARYRQAAKLVQSTREIFDLALSRMKPGVMWSQIALEMERATHRARCGIVTEYVGHGIGAELHEPPRAPAFWTGYKGEDFRLESGMTIAVEPMLTAPDTTRIENKGETFCRTRVRLQADLWSVVTADGSLACHHENVVLMTDDGARILTT